VKNAHVIRFLVIVTGLCVKDNVECVTKVALFLTEELTDVEMNDAS